MQDEIQAAVNWWCEKLKQRDIGSSGDLDTDMLFLLSNRRDISALSDDKIALFQSSLTRLLTNHFERFDHYSLSTDYGPEGLLEDALVEADITHAMGYLPMKTMMSIRTGSVQVACGYGAQYVTIYPEGKTNE